MAGQCWLVSVWTAQCCSRLWNPARGKEQVRSSATESALRSVDSVAQQMRRCGWKRLKRNPTQPEKEVFEVFAGKSSLRGTYSRRALPAGDARQRAFRRDLFPEKTNHLAPRSARGLLPLGVGDSSRDRRGSSRHGQGD